MRLSNLRQAHLLSDVGFLYVEINVCIISIIICFLEADQLIVHVYHHHHGFVSNDCLEGKGECNIQEDFGLHL